MFPASRRVAGHAQRFADELIQRLHQIFVEQAVERGVAEAGIVIADDPGDELVDGSPCIWQTRRVKSQAEIAHIRASCQLVSDAFEALTKHVAVGRMEADV